MTSEESVNSGAGVAVDGMNSLQRSDVCRVDADDVLDVDRDRGSEEVLELRSCRGKTGRVSSQGRDDTLGYAALEYYADPRTSTVAGPIEGSGRVPRGHRERCRSQDRCASPRAAAGTARLAQPRAA